MRKISVAREFHPLPYQKGSQMSSTKPNRIAENIRMYARESITPPHVAQPPIFRLRSRWYHSGPKSSGSGSKLMAMIVFPLE